MHVSMTTLLTELIFKILTHISLKTFKNLFRNGYDLTTIIDDSRRQVFVVVENVDILLVVKSVHLYVISYYITISYSIFNSNKLVSYFLSFET
jgi:hypothetical protein